MAEYIEREAVLAEIENDYKDWEKIETPFLQIIVEDSAEKPYYSILWWDVENNEFYVGYSSYCLDYVLKWREMVFEIFDADVAPVVHGRWEKGRDGAVCSVCDEFFYAPLFFAEKLQYCPHCGAKMDL